MSFSTVLIANRGEIACRVIRTCKSMGYRTVAVYATPDANALHVQLADVAVCIGGIALNDSYLSIEHIIAACKQTGADAVHPGYGFLSENAAFANACAENNITFIGPSEHAINLMGSKRLSKIAMINAGVPCVPGYEGAAQADDVLINEANRIGFPIMVKASAGGGGRGMRLVLSADDLPAALATARSEALNAFGSGELILERAVIAPRHVEVQVFGDTQGNCVYLFERDCSIQRRHQKVVEEAPCPVMTDDLREKMGKAAVAAAQSVNYVGAGTVEFLLDEGNNFYFLEMNTRLQVEHPVTEMITGLDLVEWQLRVARGEALSLDQTNIPLNGHAIEVRLYAEDPANQFLPQTGDILLWQPAHLPHVRIDHGMPVGQFQGASVSPYYDPMIAKVIAYGKTRLDAAHLLARALEDTVLLGVNHNKQFLINVLKSPVFLSGDTNTAFINQHFSADTSMQSAVATHESLCVAAVLFLQSAHNQSFGAGWATGLVAATPLILQAADKTHHLYVRMAQQVFTVTVGEHSENIRIIAITDNLLTYEYQGVRRSIAYVQPVQTTQEKTLYLDMVNGNFVVSNITHATASKDDNALNDGVEQHRAAMDGTIIDVLVGQGDVVQKGQLLAVMEAMKIQHPFKAGRDGIVTQVAVSIGTQVKKRQVLLTIEVDKV